MRFMKGVIFTMRGMSMVAPTSSTCVRRTDWMAGPTVKPLVKGGATLPPGVAFLPALAGGTEGAVPFETGAGAAFAAGLAGAALTGAGALAGAALAGAGALAAGLAAFAAGFAGAAFAAGFAGALVAGLAGALAGLAGAFAAGAAAFLATGFAGFEGVAFFTGAVVFLATLPFAETFFAAAFIGLAGALVAAFGLTLACGFAGLPLAAGFCGLATGLAGGDFLLFGAGLLAGLAAGLATGFLTGLAGAFVALGLAGLTAFFAGLDFAGIARRVLLNQSFFGAFSGETDHGVRRQKWAQSLVPDSTGCNHYSEFIHNPAAGRALGQREALIGEGDGLPDLLELGGVCPVFQGCMNPIGDLHHFGFLHATGGDGWGAYADAATEGDLLRVKRDTVLVNCDSGVVQGLTGDFAIEAFGTEVDQHEVVVCASADDAVAVAGEACGQGLGIDDHLLLIFGKAGLQCFEEAHSLRCYHMHERTTLDAREDLAVDLFDEVLAVGEDHAATRAAQRFVGGGGDEVRILHGGGVDATGNQACDVRHVDEQVSSDALGDFTHALEVDDAGVGGCSGGDHLGLLTQGDLGEFIVVDALVFLADAVLAELVEAAGEVGGVPVGEVSTVGEVHPQDFVTGLQDAEVNRSVSLGA